jgi:hypothetical protein
LRVDTPYGIDSKIEAPHKARMIASGGNDEFGTVVFEDEDPAVNLWRRRCLTYFANNGKITTVYEQQNLLPLSNGAGTPRSKA